MKVRFAMLTMAIRDVRAVRIGAAAGGGRQPPPQCGRPKFIPIAASPSASPRRRPARSP